MNRKDLLQLFKEKTGKTTIEIKDREPTAPFQASRVQDYQFRGRE